MLEVKIQQHHQHMMLIILYLILLVEHNQFVNYKHLNNKHKLKFFFITNLKKKIFFILFKEKINTIRQSKFATLRTTKVISREVEEYKRENNMYEQMVGYKRMRQQYYKELKQVLIYFILIKCKKKIF